MDEILLTKESDYLICELYKEYLNRREAGEAKTDAKYFPGGSKEIHEKYLSKLNFTDVDETCRELHRAGLLECFFADGLVWDHKYY